MRGIIRKTVYLTQSVVYIRVQELKSEVYLLSNLQGFERLKDCGITESSKRVP